MEIMRKGIYKASCEGFISHGGKIIGFRNIKAVNSFKRRYPDLYVGLRYPDSRLYTRMIMLSEKVVPYEIIPSSELKARNDFWRDFFENGQFKEGVTEPYGDGLTYISAN